MPHAQLCAGAGKPAQARAATEMPLRTAHQSPHFSTTHAQAAALLRRPTDEESAEFERLVVQHDGRPRTGPLVKAGEYEAAWLYFAVSQAERRRG